jgi:hypothetical protein
MPYLWFNVLSWTQVCYTKTNNIYTHAHAYTEVAWTNTGMPPYPPIRYPRFTAARRKLKYWRNKRFVSIKTPAKWEQAVTWWNSAAQTCPVLSSSSFAPILTLPHRTCLHSASSILAVCVSCCVIALFFPEGSYLSIQLHCFLCMLHKYSILCYLRFHVTTVGLATYYPWIQGHTCT